MRSRKKDEKTEKPNQRQTANDAHEPVKCLECHCVGTLRKTIEGTVLFPEKVKTQLKHRENNLVQQMHRKTAALKIGIEVAKSMKNESDRNPDEDVGLIENARKGIKMTRERLISAETEEKRKKKLKYTGFFSDEYVDVGARSWNRLSRQ